VLLWEWRNIISWNVKSSSLNWVCLPSPLLCQTACVFRSLLSPTKSDFRDALCLVGIICWVAYILLHGHLLYTSTFWLWCGLIIKIKVIIIIIIIILTESTVHYNRPDIVMVDDTTKEASLIDIANPNSHNIHSTMARKPQNYAYLKEDLIRMCQLQTTYTIQYSTTTLQYSTTITIHFTVQYHQYYPLYSKIPPVLSTIQYSTTSTIHFTVQYHQYYPQYSTVLPVLSTVQ
jgi:hypothetical protein